jgi:hypothetical protein
MIRTVGVPPASSIIKRCHFTLVQCFDELQELVLRALKESGDVLVVRRFRKDQGDVYGT